MAKTSNIRTHNTGGSVPTPRIAPPSKSVPYVKGKRYEIGRRKTGRLLTGRNNPHRNSMGNRKKLENVCASNTSFAETAINRPRSVEVTAIKKTASSTTPQLITARSIKKDANITGTKALNRPNNIAPESFAATIVLREIGASRSRSKERPFLSKVMVTASIEVVPNSTLMAIRPGSNARISDRFIPPDDLINCISVQDSGNMIPQLMFGGFR